MMPSDQTVLVVAAHPDDEVLGAGGTIDKYTSNGADVHVLIVTEGATQQYDDPSLVEQKITEAKRCADRLGVTEVHFGDLPDMYLDDTPHVDVNAVIEETISDVGPDTVYTHANADVNRDHDAIYESTVVATRPGSGVKRVLGYEVPSSTDWAGPYKCFSPTVFVDVSSHIEAKIEAFQAYESETRSFPHPRSEEALRSLATVRGAASGYTAAEAFVHVRERRQKL
jgi:LmbE family N-acetylglucosaminyl deacetylase